MVEITLDLDLDQYKSNNYLTHNYHSYPAKYIPQIPKTLIEKFSVRNDLILDPFCGSGTTLVEALLAGRNCVGIDLNPIAYLISKTKTTIISPGQSKKILNIAEQISRDISIGKDYFIPQFHNIDHWFKKFIQVEFSVIKHYIDKEDDPSIKDFLRVAFSAIIVKLSNQDSDTRYAFREKTLRSLESSILFKKKIEDMLRRNGEFAKKLSNNNYSSVYLADSTNLDFLNLEVSMAITSPPYMNSFDYYLYHKHRMHWLGFDVKDVQEKEFGSRNKHNDNGHGLNSYTDAIRKNGEAVKNILKKNGVYCIVVGDSILRGDLIKMNKIFDEILIDQLHFQKVHEFQFDQRKYTRSFTPNMKDIFKETYILIYQN